MAVPSRSGNVTRLNASTVGNQDVSSVAVLRDGSMVAGWADFGATAGDIRYRQFDARLVPATGTDRTANAGTAGVQGAPDVAALTGGGFAVAWTISTATNADLGARVFNAAGDATTGDITVTAAADNQRPGVITGTPNGGFVVAWEEYNSAVSGVTDTAIMARGFGVGGGALGAGPLRISGATAGVGGDAGPALAANASGFVAAWNDNSPPNGATDGIYGRSFAGSLLPASLAAHPVQIDAGPSDAFQNDVAVALLANGTQVTVWETTVPSDPAFTEIMMRRGAATAQVNTTTAGEQLNPAP